MPYRRKLWIVVLLFSFLQAASTCVVYSQNHADAPDGVSDSSVIAGNWTAPWHTGVVPKPYSFENRGTLVIEPNARYDADFLRKWFFGDEYREVWTTPIEVPVIDLDQTAGGLTPIERGGGLQTTSLHLQGDDGHFYVLRSVNKDAGRSLPEGFQGTIVGSIVQDQISSLNPLGALILPPLARAAGILHTFPTLVIIPDSPRLGEFREEFAGMLAQFERKPDEDQSEAARFGYAENVIGTTRLFEKILEDNDDRVDERAYVRARLFDMLIGDWDRHEDQWRWAEFDYENGTRFVAIPRDRDFAFVKFDGLMNRLGRLTGSITLRRLVNFDDHISDILGLNWQGSKLDRRFTSSLTRSDWVSIADSIKGALTDEEIEQAVRLWPDPVFNQIGLLTIQNLKTRRDQLPSVASEYYEMLATNVDIVGTDKHERFEITRVNDDETRVVVYKTLIEGDVVRELYRRVFYRDETDELRLYGLGGNDQFIIDGESDDGILVRIIGGEGEDTFIDRSQAPASGHLTHVYDTVEQTTAELGPEFRAHFTDDPEINEYAMERLELNTAEPIVSFDYNSEDGLFLGGGVRFIRDGFRKDPYAASHMISLNYAPRSRAYNAHYNGRLVGVWNGFDARLEAEALTENNFRNFYGQGNDTPESNRARFRAELQTVTAAPSLIRHFGRNSYFEFGPRAEFVSVELPSGLDLDDPGVGFTSEQLTDKYFVGFQSNLALDSRDSLLNPQSGLLWFTESTFSTGVRNTTNRYARLASELRYYYTFPIPSQLTLALRAGGSTNLGSFTFYQANTLGGRENLRGFPRTRFAGRSAVYTNVELRAKLFDFNIYLTKGELGLIGFIDNGRVWVDDEDSDTWHQGYGAGIWLSPYNLTIVTGSLGFSDEGSVLNFSIGFQF